MPSTTDAQARATFQDAIRRPKMAPAQPMPTHGPLAGRKPDPSRFLLPIHRIRPDPSQVRTQNKTAQDEQVRQLAESLKAIGFENPLTVRYLEDEDIYQIAAGERRFAAAKLAGFTDVPVTISDADEAAARRLQLHENIHRADLTPLELANALHALISNGDTPETLAALLCKSPAYVQKALTIARRLSPTAKAIAKDEPDRFNSMDMLYEVAQTPTEHHERLLARIRQDGLTRDEVRQVAAPLKEIAKVERGSTRGRKAKPRLHTRTIRVETGATVTISFRQDNVTDADVRTALQQALDSIE
ncbi:MAG: ParB/RepB/Spo0J family partition protein [Gemmataceae bacterium]